MNQRSKRINVGGGRILRHPNMTHSGSSLRTSLPSMDPHWWTWSSACRFSYDTHCGVASLLAADGPAHHHCKAIISSFFSNHMHWLSSQNMQYSLTIISSSYSWFFFKKSVSFSSHHMRGLEINWWRLAEARWKRKSIRKSGIIQCSDNITFDTTYLDRQCQCL
jgi:hypothetical protein